MAAPAIFARALGALSLVSLLVGAPAHAGLLEDDEARRAILDLRAKVDKNDQDQRALVADQGKQVAALAEQLAQLRRSLLELNNAIESLRTDMAALRGQNEQLARDVAELQRRQKDVITGVEDRIRKLEPQKVSVDGKEFLADPEEKRLFDEAMATFRAGDFDKAVSAFASFQRRYPGSGYQESVLFWLGNTQYARRAYKDAIGSFRALVNAAPTHPKAPEALLAIANCQVELKDRAAARRTLDELLKSYPDSEAAQAGRERLATLRG
jgi:tol-pal system protein YbgF